MPIENGLILITVGGGAVLSVWHLKRPTQLHRRILAIAAYFVVIFGLIWFVPATTTNNSASELDALIYNNQPTIIMLYSHFCVECVAMLPRVRNLGFSRI